MDRERKNPFLAAVDAHYAETWFQRFKNSILFRWADIGRRVTAAASQRRMRGDEFGAVLERAYRALAADGRNPTAEDVMKRLSQRTSSGVSLDDGDECIEDIDDDGTVTWADARGKFHKMSLGTIRNRLTAIRRRVG